MTLIILIRVIAELLVISVFNVSEIEIELLL